MTFKKLPIYIALAAFILVTSCGNKNQQGMQGPPPVQVVTYKVSLGDASYYEEYPATVKALNEVELRPQVNGYISGIHFKEGEKVKKGQKLYSIDQQQSEAAYQQALANLSVQEANLDKAQKDVDRYRELNKRDAIAKQQVDYAEATYASAVKQVDAAKAHVRSTKTVVGYTSISAPFDGTIGISSVRLGASVSPGVTLLNTISSDDPIAVDITVDQRDIYKFTRLMKNTAKNDSTFRLVFGNDVYPYPGKISIIDRAVDATTGTIKMRLTFPNPDHALRAGMSGSIHVLSTATRTVIIPYKAVNEQLGEFFVYMVDSAKATQRKVVLGEQVGKNIIIADGLKEGEVIITEGIQNLREGTPIAVSKPEAETAKK
ncbi:MAG TPA: efflux RND transporter periplasmic adaptor subunit [Ohtaekwangia sp.]